ncbi:HAD family hydrolase [Ruminococcaceae bacterium OttesenSCG-928-I18]|nr:HAD family hydrolase [Ruminococcaceae bacterium OttesenSCG-928-I18]
MFSTVVFDMDGTLLNTLFDLANAGNYTLAKLGLPTHQRDEYKKMVGNGIEVLIQRMLPEENRDSATVHLALGIFAEYYEKHQLDETVPYEGILPLLQKCKNHKISMAVLSNKDDAFAKQITSHFFGDLFREVWGLQKNYPPKPDPSSLLALLLKLGADPKHTLYCGDSNVDMLTAKNADITSCGVLWGFRSAKELSNAGAHSLVSTAEELERKILGS